MGGVGTSAEMDAGDGISGVGAQGQGGQDGALGMSTATLNKSGLDLHGSTTTDQAGPTGLLGSLSGTRGGGPHQVC